MEGIAVFVGKHQHIRCRAVARGTDAGYLHPRQQAAHDQAVCHVAAIAHKAEFQPCQRAPALPDGHQVSQHLTGVGVVGKAVDHRNAGKLRQLFQVPLAVGAPDGAVVVAPQHPGGVPQRLAAPGL